MGILSQTFGDKLNNFQTASSSSSPIQVTTTSGKQYTLDNNQVDWIQSRYKQDGASTYGWDDAANLPLDLDAPANEGDLPTGVWFVAPSNNGTVFLLK